MIQPLEPKLEIPLYVEIDLTSPEQLRDFLNEYGGKLNIEKQFDTCSSSVKIRHIGHIDEETLVFEFATDEDKRFYRQAGEIGQYVEFIIVE